MSSNTSEEGTSRVTATSATLPPLDQRVYRTITRRPTRPLPTLERSSTDPFQTAASLITFGEGSSRQAQPGEGRRAEQGVIQSGRVIPCSRTQTLPNPHIAVRNTVGIMGVKRTIKRKDTGKKINIEPGLTVARLYTEAQNIEKNAPTGCHAAPKDDDLFEWAGVIEGPEGTVYAGGTFFCTIIIPEQYPFLPPKVNFLTRIYHCNINAQGEVCVDILNDKWNSTMTISTVLETIVTLMIACNPDDPLVVSIGKQYRENKEEFDKTARIWTTRYAA